MPEIIIDRNFRGIITFGADYWLFAR